MRDPDHSVDPPSAAVSVQDLARRARGGSSDCLTALFERLAPPLYAWAALRIQPHRTHAIDPEDFVQDVWWRVLECFEEFDPERGSFRGWVFGIATNTLLHALRRLGLRQDKGDAAVVGRSTLDRLPAEATAISHRVARDEALRATIRRVQALPDDERTLFVLFALEELKAAEVAQVMNLSADAAAKRWQRLRRRLGEQLAL